MWQFLDPVIRIRSFATNTRARERQADFLAAQTVDISDNTSKWLASKLAPKKYGEKIAAELSGPEGGPVQNNVNFRFFDDKPPEK